MKNNPDKIINRIMDSAQSVRMSDAEKSRVKANLSSFMSFNPTISPYVKYKNFWHIITFNHEYIFALLLILFIGTGSVFGAKNSLPGDILYPVKTNINENIESLVAISSKAKADVEVQHAVTRLEEAETLQLKGELSNEKSTEIKNNFSNSVNSINLRVKNFEKDGDLKSADEVNDNLTKEMDNHFKAFLKVSGESTSTQPFSGLINLIKNRKELEQKNRNKLQIDSKNRD